MQSWRSVSVVVVVVALAAVACTRRADPPRLGAPTPPAVDAACVWKDFDPPRSAESARWRAIALRGGEPVAAGSDGSLATMARWTGVQWESVPLPRVGPEIRGLSFSSADDGWAVGATSLLRYRAGAWRAAGAPLGDLNAIAARTPNDAWAVGTTGMLSDEIKAHAQRWDGRRWRAVTVPRPGVTSFLQDVAIVSASEAWAVGLYQDDAFRLHTLVLRWNGRTWSRVPSPNPGLGGELTAVAATRGEAFATGSYDDATGQRSMIVRWDGKRWKTMGHEQVGVSGAPGWRPAYGPQLEDVAILARGEAWAVGWSLEAAGPGLISRTLAYRLSGSRWIREATPGRDPTAPNDWLLSVATVSAIDLWTVGSAPRLAEEGSEGSLALRRVCAL